MKLSKDEQKSETQKSNTKIWLVFIVLLIMVLIGIAFFYFKIEDPKNNSNNQLGTFKNPEVAFKETQKALDLISKNINVGIISVQHINEYEESKNLIFKKQK